MKAGGWKSDAQFAFAFKVFQGESFTAESAAREFGVSVRSIHRWIIAIERLVPIMRVRLEGRQTITYRRERIG